MRKFDTKNYVRAELEQALGPDNKWFAGEKLGHSPTENEAITHFINHGGAKNFFSKHVQDFFYETTE